MSEELTLISGTKSEQYENLWPQILALTASETDVIARMATVAAALKQQFDWFWVGFYREMDEKLIVGPFQGPVACLQIEKGRGVCGACWENKKTIVVPNVHKFPGHISCNALPQSEIVVPVFRKDTCIAVLDVDGLGENEFDDTDKQWLERIADLLVP